MITGDNPLTAVHVAQDVEIVDCDALMLDLKENAKHDADLKWRNVDETIFIPVDPSAPLDQSLLDKYNICITGAALKQFECRPSRFTLVQRAWVYARVSPAQKEHILTSLRSLGYITLMAGDGTNGVGALKQKIAEHQRLERIKKVYQTQLNVSARFNQPLPPVLPAIANGSPEAVEAHARAAAAQQTARQRNPLEKVSICRIDNEKFLFKRELKVEQMQKFDLENAKDIIAVGFKLEEMFIFSGFELVDGPFYRNVSKVSRQIMSNQAKAAFVGFNDSTQFIECIIIPCRDNIGKIHFVTI